MILHPQPQNFLDPGLADLVKAGYRPRYIKEHHLLKPSGLIL